MLLGEDLGGRHQRGLSTAADRLHGGQCRDHRLAAADIALQKTVHRLAAGEVARDLMPGTHLSAGECEGQRRQQTPCLGLIGQGHRTLAGTGGAGSLE